MVLFIISWIHRDFLDLMCNLVGLDQLSRLHMILKPFMLRRIKKDVENELSEKVD